MTLSKELSTIVAMHITLLKGNGPPLLFLHGWGQSHQSLLPLAQLLTPYSSPILIDLPGFGKSPAPEGAWSSFDYAGAIVSELDRLHFNRVAICGHSFGGKVAMSLAIRYPDRVSQLFLLAASGIRAERSWGRWMRHQAIRTAAKILKGADCTFKTALFQNYFIPRFASSDYKNAGAMRRILVKSVNEDLSSELGKICCPTCILWGELDRETPLEMGKRLAQQIPNAQFYSFPHHNHYLIDDTGSQLCARYLIRGLKNQPAPASKDCSLCAHSSRT